MKQVKRVAERLDELVRELQYVASTANLPAITKTVLLGAATDIAAIQRKVEGHVRVVESQATHPKLPRGDA